MPSGIVIIDYGMGNLHSVENAFSRNGARVRISSKPRDIEKAQKIVLPGVGAFTQAMQELKKRRLIEPLREKIISGAPYLGLCLGLQLLFSRSEEGERVAGLDIFPGVVRRFRGDLKVPHMGWNSLSVRAKKCPLLKGVEREDFFYFVHSFYAAPKDKSCIAATTDYGVEFCSAVWKDRIFATQFHPEKSQLSGQKLIRNFIRLK